MIAYGAPPCAGTRRTRVLGRTRLCVLVALSSGCYRSVPIALSELRPNEEVDVRLTNAAATRFVGELGAYMERLQGLVSVERGDSVSVSVLIGREMAGVQLTATRMPLFVARTEVVDVRRRQFSRTRSVLATAGALMLFGIVVGTVSQAGDPNPPRDDPTTPPPVGVRIGMRLRFP